MDNGVHRFNENVRKGQWRPVDSDSMTGRAFSLPQQSPPEHHYESIGHFGGKSVMHRPSNRAGCPCFLPISLANEYLVVLASGAVSHHCVDCPG